MWLMLANDIFQVMLFTQHVSKYKACLPCLFVQFCKEPTSRIDFRHFCGVFICYFSRQDD